MLEYLKASKHLFSVGRQTMGDSPAAIGLVEESGLDQAASMFGDCFQVAVEAAAQIVEGDSFGSADEEQDADTAMVRDALEVPFELLICLTPCPGHRS
jgi:hypothetical protein